MTTKEDVIALANEYLNVTPDGKVVSIWRIIDSGLRIEEDDNAACDVVAKVDLTNNEITLKFEPPLDGDWSEIEALLINELDRAVGEAYTFSVLMKADSEAVTHH